MAYVNFEIGTAYYFYKKRSIVKSVHAIFPWGPSINYVSIILAIFDPLPPFISKCYHSRTPPKVTLDFGYPNPPFLKIFFLKLTLGGRT